MIINTVILFLRDLLPVFILLCYLKVFFSPKELSFTYWTSAISLGLMGTLLFFSIAQMISEWFEGAGIEILRASLLLLVYISLFFSDSLIAKQPKESRLFLLISLFGISAFITLKGSAFIIFFDVYWQQKDNLINIALGCFVGLGICISFSTLYIFLLTELKQKSLTLVVKILWYLFLAGQLSHIITYLSQVDLLITEQPIINLDHYIKDSSEYGHILNALFGYEASLSATFIGLYGLAFILLLVINNHKKIRTPDVTETTHYE